MIVLDTTVLVYAVGSSHEFREPCRALISAIAGGELEATTTPEVIQEFVHVRARRRGRADAVALGRDYSELLAPLLQITADHLTAGLAAFEGGERLGSFDAVLAAGAAASGASALVSVDAAFDEFPGLAHVIPDAAGLNILIGT